MIDERAYSEPNEVRRRTGPGWISKIRVAALTCALFAAMSIPAEAATSIDSDGDLIPDHVERATGTDPFDPDTDGDGVPDGMEDRDRDGTVGPGESDPRVPGLFPGTAPHIPEPLVFDLVRGLGARRGELEINVLAQFRPESPHVLWAPEIEWAFADGYAVELEVPMADDEIEALKLALQGTLPIRSAKLAHGWQIFGEASLDERHGDIVGTYIFGQRLRPTISWLGMLGGKAELRDSGFDAGSAIANASIFYEPREWQTWGLETNLDVRSNRSWTLQVTPQLHVQLSRRLRLQVGVGFTRDPEGIDPVGALRVIVE